MKTSTVAAGHRVNVGADRAQACKLLIIGRKDRDCVERQAHVGFGECREDGGDVERCRVARITEECPTMQLELWQRVRRQDEC